jgi:hypothetical protein
MLALEDIRALHQAIGLVVVMPRPDGSLSVEGSTPDWLRKLGGGELNDPEHAIGAGLLGGTPGRTAQGRALHGAGR